MPVVVTEPAVPPEEDALDPTFWLYVKVVADGTVATLNVPLKLVSVTPAIVTNCPPPLAGAGANEWDVEVVMVTMPFVREAAEIAKGPVVPMNAATSGASRPNESIVTNLAARPFCLRCPFISNDC